MKGSTMENKEPYAAFTLLVDGKEAFPALLQAIAQAEKSLYINMFIWRDDSIGNQMAAAVLAAADRGVEVYLSIDRYGVVLEKCEECQRSFFHKTQTPLEKMKSCMLRLSYPAPGSPLWVKDEESEVYRRLLCHPHVTVSSDVFKADHSKYYVIDDKLLFLGGINIEDKENGADRQGRLYQDYMVRLAGEEYVRAFFAKLKGERVLPGHALFGINSKQPRCFEMEERYLSVIREAERELYITMAYFSPLPAFMQAILDAVHRGVQVTIMIPTHANFQDDTNRKTVRRLLKKSKGKIEVLLSPKMLHTKLVASEKTISFGSTNITKKAFAQLSELNLFVENRPCAFCRAVMASVKKEHALARPVASPKEIRYRRIYAFFEGFFI